MTTASLRRLEGPQDFGWPQDSGWPQDLGWAQDLGWVKVAAAIGM
jgi:hypothetical protein